MIKTPKEILDEKLSQVQRFKNLSDNDKRIINEISKTKPSDISDLSQYTSTLDNIITKETNNEMLHSGLHIEENEPMYTHDELKTKEENAELVEDLSAAREANIELASELLEAKNFIIDSRHKTLMDNGSNQYVPLTAFDMYDKSRTLTNKRDYIKRYNEITGRDWNNKHDNAHFTGGYVDSSTSPYITYGGAAGIIGGNILVNNCKCLLIGILILLVLYFIYIMVCECINSYKTKKYRYQYII